MHGEPMRVRKNGKGGRHVAIERGMVASWNGWPFRRELRQLAAEARWAGRRDQRPAAEQEVNGARPCQA
jgi:hypothetical protein